jgi:CelD/BcsL family acetyltransferase involved in cellulose biosynthesis
MNLRLEKIDYPSAAFDTLLPEWEALDAQVFPRMPFTSPNWIRLWWQHCRRHTTSTLDEFYLHTLRDESGHLIAIAPLMVTRRPAFGPLQLRILQFIGSDPSITEIRGVICRLDNQDAVVRALLEYFSLLKSELDVFLWRGVRNVGIAADTLVQLGGLANDDILPCYLLDLPESWEKLLAGLSSNMRKSIRKSYEFLERDGHKFLFRSQNQPEQLSAALECFFSLYAARSRAQGMKTHLDRLTGHPRHRAIIADFAKEMAQRGQLHMLQLEIEGTVVATRIGFQLGDDLYLYFSGYDPKWRKYSVMTTLMAETIKWAIKNGMKRINLSTGSDPGKLRWRPDEVKYHNSVSVSPTLRGRLVSSTYRLTSRAYDAFLRWRGVDE